MFDGEWIAQGYAPGKLILTGEHAVVHGHLAVAVALDRGTTVSLASMDGPTRIASAACHDQRLQQAVAALLPPQGVSVSIETQLPVGRGLGSSAALSVALVRANAHLEGREASFAECHRQGFVAERIFHGNPSGVDHTVCALGSAVRYRRGEPAEPFTPPALQLVIMDSGTAGDTAAMVNAVASLPDARQRLADIGAVSKAISSTLTANVDPKTLGALMVENHRLLQGIGVSTPMLDALVDAACNAGALGAKLAGAGGGGVAVALVDDPEPVLRAVQRLGCTAFSVQLGGVSDRKQRANGSDPTSTVSTS